MVENSLFSLGSRNPEQADVELSVNKKTNSLESKNPEHTDVELSVNKKTNSLGSKYAEHADEEFSVNKKVKNLGSKDSERNKINNIKMLNSNQVDDLEKKIIDIIEEEHSKINVQIPFRTDIRGEINTINDRAIYGKQYPYALSVSDFVNSEINRMLNENIIRPSRSPYNAPVLGAKKAKTKTVALNTDSL